MLPFLHDLSLTLQMLVIRFKMTFILLSKYIILNKIHTEANTELFVIKEKQKTFDRAQSYIQYRTKYTKFITVHRNHARFYKKTVKPSDNLRNHHLVRVKYAKPSERPRNYHSFCI